MNVTLRVLGLASTTRGFAFAITEGPDRLVSAGTRRISASRAATVKQLDIVLSRARALFVAFERETVSRKRRRGQIFSKALTEACASHGVLIVNAPSRQVSALALSPRASRWEVAGAMTKRFPEIAHRLPKKRRPWESEDDRIGMFLALAAAVVVWDSFRNMAS